MLDDCRAREGSVVSNAELDFILKDGKPRFNPNLWFNYCECLPLLLLIEKCLEDLLTEALHLVQAGRARPRHRHKAMGVSESGQYR